MPEIMILITGRDPGEKEFHQAVKEMVEVVDTMLDQGLVYVAYS